MPNRIAIIAAAALALGAPASAGAHIARVPMRSADHRAAAWARSFAPDSYTVHCHRLGRGAYCRIHTFALGDSQTPFKQVDGPGEIVDSSVDDLIYLHVRHGHTLITYSQNFGKVRANDEANR